MWEDFVTNLNPTSKAHTVVMPHNTTYTERIRVDKMFLQFTHNQPFPSEANALFGAEVNCSIE